MIPRAGSDAATGTSDKFTAAESSTASTDGAKQIRRRRLQLSCGECRKKKVRFQTFKFLRPWLAWADMPSSCHVIATGRAKGA